MPEQGITAEQRERAEQGNKAEQGNRNEQCNIAGQGTRDGIGNRAGQCNMTEHRQPSTNCLSINFSFLDKAHVKIKMFLLLYMESKFLPYIELED